jgi:hydrogenase-4 component B
MQSDLLLAMAVLWGISFVAALLESSGRVARIGIVLGCAAGIAGCLMNLHRAMPVFSFGFRVSDTPVQFHLDAGGSWLLLFGLLTALFAAGLGTTASAQPARRYWLAGLSLTLLGTLGVFGLQDAMSFLIAWEVMSVGAPS